MRRKLLVSIIGLCLVVGCGKQGNIDEVVDNKESVTAIQEVCEENIYSREELLAYKDILVNSLKEQSDGFGAALIYIDDDNYYELAIINGDAHNEGVYLYTYKDGKAVSLQNDNFPFYGSYGSFSYVKKENLFYYYWDGAGVDKGHDLFFAFTIEEGKAIPCCELEQIFYYEDDTKHTFYNFSEEILEDEYNSLYQKYSVDGILVDDDLCTHVSTEDEIDTFLKKYDVEDVELTEADLKQMTPDELFTAFCDGQITAEARSYYSDEIWNIDADNYQFVPDTPEEERDATLMVEKTEPVDLDNDGEVEFVLANPVYGDMCFDCKDGKVICFAQGEGTAAYCSYTLYDDAYWIVHSDTLHVGRCTYNLEKFNGDLEVVDSFAFGWEDWEDDGIKRFYKDDQDITEAEYEELLKQFN